MRCIILLTLVALCYSYPYGSGYGSGHGSGYGSGFGYGSWLGSVFGSGKNFNVNKDGSITFTTANGKMITISKDIGQENVVVAVTDPYVSGKQYYSDYQKYQPSQVDTLAQILSQYQGDINQNTYQQLLGDVNSAVQGGQLNNDIYEVLQNLNQIQGGQGQTFGQQPWQTLQQAQQVQQLLQQQGLQYQYPNWQTSGAVQEVVMPVGINQQGQIAEKVFLQAPTAYPSISGYQSVYGQYIPGGNTFAGSGSGKANWNALINSILNGQQHNALEYGQYQVGPSGQTTTGQLFLLGGEILNRQNQIHQELVQQHQQMLQQQFHHQQQEQQLQGQQQYVQQLQEQVQKEQEHVLGQQQQIQQQQKYHTLMGLLHPGKLYIQTEGQQVGLWQQQPGVYSQGGLHGVYGQGIQHQNIPFVL